ncbi:hypothetical protein [Idiomarina aminovorans]|uniref:hypothetical protein n=1 Tax=Idiomarina aminovorans TaxID=2914829 RepID=UPI002002B77E|nr:hypothetical protein [Idiomarina sp. ATCH4]MCK7458501.1 hypothetical protein [Idiomarina sp. ATCH4]
MAFKLAKAPIKSDATVSVSVPGHKKPQEFTAKFQVMKHEDYRERTEKRSDDLELLKDVVIGWDGVEDESGNDVPFSEAALVEMCEYTFVRTAFLRTYNELMFGYTAAKN